MNKIIFILTFFCFSVSYADSENPLPLDIYQIENLTGIKGTIDLESGTYKVISLRTNLKATAAGIRLTPALGLASWIVFKPLSSEVEIKGELVLLEDQINFIMQEALDQKLTITSLHNDYLWDTPRLMVMGIEGKGDLKNLAAALGKIFNLIKTSTTGTIWKRPPAMINPEKSTLTSAHLEDFFNKKCSKKEGVTKFTWEDDPMKTSSWTAFAGTEREAVMLGDLVLNEKSIQSALKTLLHHNIFIISLRPINEEEKVIHYLGRGPALELAKILKEILEQTATIDVTSEIHTYPLTPIESKTVRSPTSHTQ